MKKMVGVPWGDLSQDFYELLFFARAEALARDKEMGRTRCWRAWASNGGDQVEIKVCSGGQKSSIVSSRETCSTWTRGKGSRGKKKGGAEVGGSKKKAGIAPCPQK